MPCVMDAWDALDRDPHTVQVSHSRRKRWSCTRHSFTAGLVLFSTAFPRGAFRDALPDLRTLNSKVQSRLSYGGILAS